MVDAVGFARFNGNYGEDESHMRRFCRWNPHIDIDSPILDAKKVSLSADELWRTWPAVKGFSFYAKRWGELFVEALEPVKYRPEAVQSLVMDGDRKQMVLAMVQHADKSFSDVVDGKGGGCIFLLHGPLALARHSLPRRPPKLCGDPCIR